MRISKRELENLHDFYDIVEQITNTLLKIVTRLTNLEKKYESIRKSIKELYTKYNASETPQVSDADMIILNTNSFNTVAREIAEDMNLS